ncbi:MAG: anaerobic ribonucleoside-triphosphate reductase activating protein, partial [Candidatus Hydrogenedentes bacterium]|nr:anaerobic ribonucleoside-triphosphate reductase activating protein [Candidatus Hydrogenedentota bacterium]
MKIAGVVKCSFVDYPDRMAAVVFTPGCNLRCVFCHNKGLVDANATCHTTQHEVLAWLETRRGLLDAVVVSGGEPMLQTDLTGFIKEVHAMGYLVKLDTNGTQPDALASVLNSGAIGYVAMDIKAPFEKYEAICGVPVDLGAVND